MIKQFFSNRLNAVCLSVMLALCGTVVFTRPVTNQYESAQRQTVLIQTDNAQGSGVAIRRTNKDGNTRWFVWTAAHVVECTTKASVIVIHRVEGHKAGRTTYDARVIARNAKGDFALLQVNCPADAFFPAEFATELPHVGDAIFAVGNMLGENFDGSVSKGNVAQLGIFPERVNGWPWLLLDQSTAPVYPGNSGGPVFNTHNLVLGLIVGGMNATLNGYIPIRTIEPWATENGFLWSIRGKRCPADTWLDERALALLTELTE